MIWRSDEYEPYPPIGRRRSRADRIARIFGPSPRRYLSQALIFLLLLLGPITFTTEKIQNFQPDCETGKALRVKSSVGVTVSQQTRRVTPRKQLEPPLQAIVIAPAAPAMANLFFPSCYSRPPPYAC